MYTYLTEWQRQYGSDYIQVIALQSPKYEEEKTWNVIEEKIKERDVNFPVGLDEDRKTAQLYSVELVPTVFVIDKNGYIRYTHKGESGFGETQKAIEEVIMLDFSK